MSRALDGGGATLDRAWVQHGGRENGFDTIRLIAAIAVLVSHAFALTGFSEPLAGTARGMSLGVVAVAAFFVISGYFVAASAQRHSWGGYLKRRARRVYPGLVACVAVCLAAGLFLTALPPARFVAASGTWHFALNALGLPAAYDLPGVFRDRPEAGMNGSLWTLPYEIACYGIALAIARLGSWRRGMLLALWLAAMIASRWFDGSESGALFLAGWLAFLFRFFGAGMLLHAYADRIPRRADLALLSVTLLSLSPLVGLFAEALATLGAYALVVAGFAAPRWFGRLTRRGDISYGVYLYAFPIQQLVVPLSLASAVPWLMQVAVALPLTLMAGLLSWLLVERRFLGHRASQRSAR